MTDGATDGRRGSASTSRGCGLGSNTPAVTSTGRTGPFARTISDIGCPVLIVAGWADGYRNNSFRTVEALRAAGRHVELLAGPWPHAATSSCLPGPRIDLVPEMVAWWDRWLRGNAPTVEPPPARWYAKASHRPAPDLDEVPGGWRADEWPTPRTFEQTWPISPKPPYDVVADIGLVAWLSCSRTPALGSPDDQRTDDVRALTWDWPLADGLGDRRVSDCAAADSGRPNRSPASPCDCVNGARRYPTLVSRGFLNLTRREGMATAEPLVSMRLRRRRRDRREIAWRWAPGHVLRLALAGAD